MSKRRKKKFVIFAFLPMQSIICFLRLKVQDNFCISIIITWLFWGQKQTPLNEKLSFVEKLYSAVEILTTVEILHSSSHHLSNVRQQEPLSTAGSAVWLYAANFDWLYSYVDSNQGAASPTSYLLRWVLLQCSGTDLTILHLFFMGFELFLPTSKLVLIHTRKEQFALMVAPMQVPAEPCLFPVDFVRVIREDPFCCQPGSTAWLVP